MQAIHDNLVQKGVSVGLTHIMELIPSQKPDRQVYDAFLCDCLRGLPHQQFIENGNYRLNKII